MIHDIVLLFLLVLVSSIQAEGGVIHHFGVDKFDVEVHVKYDPSCSSKTNFTQLVTVPRGSSLLNVLEHANNIYPTFNGFKVLYLANSSYNLISLNNDTDTQTCHWMLSTDPATLHKSTEGISLEATVLGGILSTPLNGLYVSNIGMMINFTYQQVKSQSKAKSTPHTKHVKQDVLLTAMWMTVKYTVVYNNKECPSNSGSLSSPSTTLTIPCGSSVLNVMETAANLQPAHHFVVKNVFGKYYLIDSIGGTGHTSRCGWCAYFSPSLGSPSYLLTADINNFIIPLSGGVITMKYQLSCINNDESIALGQGEYTYFISALMAQYGGPFSAVSQAVLREYCQHNLPKNTTKKKPAKKEKGATGNV